MLLSPNTGYHARVRRSTPPFTSLALLILIALPLAVPLLLARPGDAQEPPAEFAPYLRRTDGRPADPINVIFIGEGDAGQIAPKLTGLFRWVPVNGSSMAFVDHGQTRWAEVQLGTVADAGVRRHIRLAGAAAESARWGRYTLASVHHDLVVPCGHVGLGFDEERDALALAMRNAGYALSWVYLGNDDPVEHCSGAQTRGDGWAAVIDLRSSGTPAPSPTPAPAASPMPAPTPSPSPSPSPEPPAATPSPTPAPPAPPELPSPVEGPQPPDIRG